VWRPRRSCARRCATARAFERQRTHNNGTAAALAVAVAALEIAALKDALRRHDRVALDLHGRVERAPAYAHATRGTTARPRPRRSGAVSRPLRTRTRPLRAEFHFGELAERLSQFREPYDLKEDVMQKDLEARKCLSALEEGMQQRDSRL
jgi:hypothetical protein